MKHPDDSTDIKFPLVKPLPHNRFDRDSLKVYYRLKRHNYTAYFVGGCVRDLLLGNIPKDFDIVTSARPHQVRRVFRNSRVIGRRFLLANVFFGSKIIEVSTFRRTPWKNGVPTNQKKLLIKNDNNFGSDEEDAMRRDFTINALFYEPADRMVIDYVDGIDDLQRGKIRTIGDPKIRFAEDPIRMIRALKFAAKLNFDIVSDVRSAIADGAHQLSLTPVARISLEILKILRGSDIVACFHTLKESPVLAVIAPEVEKILEQQGTFANRMLLANLQALDNMNFRDRANLSDAALFAALSYPTLAHKNQKLRKSKSSDISLNQLEQNLGSLARSINISKKIMEKMHYIICIQPFLERKNLKALHSVDYLVEAVDFLKIRAAKQEVSRDIIKFWEKQTCFLK